MPGQSHKALRGGRQRLDYRLEQPYPYGELDEERPKAADRVDAVCLVDSHRFAGKPLTVVGMLLLEFLQLGLEFGHLLHLAALAHGERDKHRAHQQRECDDGDAEV